MKKKRKTKLKVSKVKIQGVITFVVMIILSSLISYCTGDMKDTRLKNVFDNVISPLIFGCGFFLFEDATGVIKNLRKKEEDE